MNKKTLVVVVAALAALAGGCNSKKSVPQIVEGPELAEPSVTPSFDGTEHGPGCTEDHLGLGMGLVEGGQVKDGIVELEKGVFDHPGDFDTRKALGEASLK